MNKMKKCNKGFTLTELAIVIAVIAILIAVLVPTFISLVNKAEESSDKQLVKNLNTVLVTEGVSDSIETPADALSVLADNGYSVDKLKTSSDSEIIYDQTTATFALLTDGVVSYPESASIDTSASTTWYFAYSQADIEENTTVSYILSGEWNESVKYVGSGGIETSFATVNATVYVKHVDISTNSADVKVQAANTSVKKATSKTTDTYAVILNIVNAWSFIYQPEGTFTTLPKLCGNTTYNVVDKNGDSIPEENLSKYLDTSSTTAERNTDYNVKIDNESGSVTFTINVKGTVVEITSENINTSGGSVIVELGTEKYPYYIASEDDLTKLNNGGYCEVTANVTSTTAVTINSGIETELNLGSHTVTINGYTDNSYAALLNNGTLTVTNGTLYVYGDLGYCWSGIENNGTLTVGNDVKVSSTYYTIVDKGYLNIYGTVESLAGNEYSIAIYTLGNEMNIYNGASISGYRGLYAYGTTVNMYGGTVCSIDNNNIGVLLGSRSSDNVYGTLNVTAGTISGKWAVVNYGTVTINGATVSGINYAFENYGTLNIDSGTITASSYYGIYNNGTTIINGGTITATEDYGIYNNGTTKINGGTITGLRGILNYSSLEMTGGTVSGEIGIWASGTGSKTTLSGNAVVSASLISSTENASKNYQYIYGIYLCEGADLTVKENATVKAVTDTLSDYWYGCAICLWGVSDGDASSDKTTVTVEGGTITGTTLGISGNGSTGYGYTEITISGGTVKSGGTAIYHPQIGGKLTVSGGTIEGVNTAIELRAGELIVTGGTIKSSAKYDEVQSNGNGTTTVGAAIAIVQHTTKQYITVTISGGEISGYNALLENNIEGNTFTDGTRYEDHITINISGGTFTSTDTGNSGVAVYGTSTDTITITGGTFNTTSSNFVDSNSYTVTESEGIYTVSAK